MNIKIICPNCNKILKSNINYYIHLTAQCIRNIDEVNDFILKLKDVDELLYNKAIEGHELIKQYSAKGNSTIKSITKGKSFDEIYGIEKSKSIKSKISNSMKKNGTGWNYHKIKSSEELTEIYKSQIEHKKEIYDGHCYSEEGRLSISNRMKINNPMFKEEVKQKRDATCIKLYGVDNVMKVPEIRIKSHTNGDRFNFYSKISQKFFKEIDISLNLTNSYFEKHEWFISVPFEYFNQDIIFIDYYNKDVNMVIEFYGDYWHDNPKYYKPTDFIHGMKVMDIWDKDRKRKSLIINKLSPKYFYEVWESEYEKMMEVIINDINNERNLG